MPRVSTRPRCGGFTLLELLVTLSLVSICIAMAAPSLRELYDPLDNSAAHLASFLKEVRATAVSTTSAYTVRPVSATRLQAVYGSTCSDTTTTADSSRTLTLDRGASLESTAWSVCFSSRGIADDNDDIGIRDSSGARKVIRVYLGGGARIL